MINHATTQRSGSVQTLSANMKWLMVKFEPNKFLVVNRKYLNDIPGWKCGLVAWALRTIEDHVPENKYYVCNQDEPYADKVIATILEGEAIKVDKHRI